MPTEMQKIEITPRVWRINFSDARTLCSTFMRFQEHYESPCEEFRKRPFTRGEFLQWYTGKYGGDYCEHWSGMNVPGHIFTPFIEGLFDPLTVQERELLELIQPLWIGTSNFYVIGTHNGGGSTAHEICHALYYTVPGYAQEVGFILGKYDLGKMWLFLEAEGYDKSVFNDEAQAYLTADWEWLRESRGLEFPEKLRDELIELRMRHHPPNKNKTYSTLDTFFRE